ncbi:HTH-type transcriptional regulator immR [uncultured Ruminococcus sp.]|uniref:Helix-turn-helix transcriptional regulator n=1 Tax=Massiliimalia timonensis TaxID=1987501 RepID=A0A8J6TQU8_9FIRM|nr:helix-turn-helix transcriptional regulator [Massiliimalia timonensis]MBC8609731.1 helix-turn-helix transcriptional regulator [Massiliimalia timonensis]SCH28309.1 HTH-type transcriptional regulator immR [uncultured Ruminococcus sp.]SCH32493.1 HTH-type transcriptional regulator immR [uncultured Clostridium sp.]
MNSDFPRILTLLRKERGISQKQAAAELNISQALLSHYEKGIRECGLDFVVRTADFYGVSCDYLLGRSPERTGATLSVDDLPESDTAADNRLSRGSILPVLNKKLIVNSLTITFDLLQKLDQNAVTTEVSNYLMLSVYHMFRMLYRINPKNESNLFTIPQNISSQMTTAQMIQCEARLRSMIENTENKKEYKFDHEKLSISTESLQQNYAQLTSSLLNLIKNSEGLLK